MKVNFRVHALKRMFQRSISEEEVVYVIKNGKIIEEYPSDTPYPSCLKLGFVNNRPLHIVLAENKQEDQVIIITAYEPEISKWQQNFERRK